MIFALSKYTFQFLYFSSPHNWERLQQESIIVFRETIEKNGRKKTEGTYLSLSLTASSSYLKGPQRELNVSGWQLTEDFRWDARRTGKQQQKHAWRRMFQSWMEAVAWCLCATCAGTLSCLSLSQSCSVFVEQSTTNGTTKPHHKRKRN